jgi:hypothetical protein
MQRILRTLRKRLLTVTLVALAGSGALRAQEKAVPAGGTVNITVTPGVVPAPPVSLNLLERHGHVTPIKTKHTHTGGGLIDVQSPSADTVIITMSGAVVGNGSMHFDLDQCFEVGFDDPKVKKAKLTIEGRVIGLLRGEPKASAEYSEATATIAAGSVEVITVAVPPHSVSGCENLAVNDHDGPKSVPVTAGKYTLHQCFTIAAKTDSCLGKRSSAEFAPDPALDPMWINFWEPFHGVKKDSFGYQLTIKVANDTDPAPAAEAPAPAK